MAPVGSYIEKACETRLIEMGFCFDENGYLRRHLMGNWDLFVSANALPRYSEVTPFAILYSLEIEAFCRTHDIEVGRDATFINRPAKMIDPACQSLKFNRDKEAAVDRFGDFVGSKIVPYFLKCASWENVLSEDLSPKNRYYFDLIRPYALMCVARNMVSDLLEYFENVDAHWTSIRGTGADRFGKADKTLSTLNEVREELAGFY